MKLASQFPDGNHIRIRARNKLTVNSEWLSNEDQDKWVEYRKIKKLYVTSNDVIYTGDFLGLTVWWSEIPSTKKIVGAGESPKGVVAVAVAVV